MSLFSFEFVNLFEDQNFRSFENNSMAELANASVVRPRDPGSNLGVDRKYFLQILLSHLNSNLKDVSF
jgi:hypothetical protein